MDDTGAPDRTVTADHLLTTAERAFLRAEFGLARPLLQRFQSEFGTTEDEDAALRYTVLRSALAARAGNWQEAVRRLPDSDDLGWAETGIVHALAVGALRRLSEEGRHLEAGTAALAIVLWAHLLDEEDPGDFRGLVTERRGTPVPDELWEDARRQLLEHVTDLLHALDVRAGRDVLNAWETAWEAEQVGPQIIPSDAGPDDLIPLSEAAWLLVAQGRRTALLDAYTARHPDPSTWTSDSPDHLSCADPVSRALAARAQDRIGAGEWDKALADFSRAARLGRTLDTADRAAVLRAGKNVGRGRNGHGYSSVARIHGLELAHRLLPQDGSLALDLAAELVRQGMKVLHRDPEESWIRFTRALAVSPDAPGAQSGLDELLRADLARAFAGARPSERIRAHAVEDLLRRDPDCGPARKWLKEHYAAQAMASSSDGHRTTARPRSNAETTRAALEHRVDVLSTALADADPPASLFARDMLDEELLRLTEHLEATASPSDVIELFLRGHMRTGVSARFDQTVETAYLRRAQAREEAGDVGGARRDRACAERIGAGLPDQGLLFGPPPGRVPGRKGLHPDDSGQGSLF
ncbi:hypothetical protein ABZ926_29220 [Streptomyces litmocidini]|uniref:hypothetical protein n=1 Tax=Streptomyces litmocidini TaxID=67318 RepID=UPI0033F07CED